MKMKVPNTGYFRVHFCCLGTFVTKLPPSNLAITQERSSIYELRKDNTRLIKGTSFSQNELSFEKCELSFGTLNCIFAKIVMSL